MIDELTELSKLYKSGALTEEEYKAAKQKVLNNVNG
ncbi:MAG: SHOCT domain-containing protein [Sedimenticola sp.]